MLSLQRSPILTRFKSLTSWQPCSLSFLSQLFPPIAPSVLLYRTVLCVHSKVLHARVSVAVSRLDSATAISILTSNCFPTYGSDRALLVALWFEAQYVREQARVRHPLSRLEMHQVRVANPSPPSLGVTY
jgi:hypothetical protein